jgi:exosome complex component RRP4
MDFSLPEQKKKKKTKLVSSAVNHVIPGEVITQETGYLRGHGTFVQDEKLVATISGVVERVNKLISVRPLKSRYTGEVGDVVVGRIKEVGQKRWKVDMNSRQDGMLLLSSINLPGGVQRRRTEADVLLMRSYFAENDLISAEVQQFYSDGSISIHTRSLKYGKLEGGQFLAVRPVLMKRQKSSFHTLPCGVDVILGINGYIWLSPPKDVPSTETAAVVREKIARVRNAIEALSRQFIPIYPLTIMDTYEAGLAYPAKDMMKPELAEKLTARAQQREGIL